MFIHVLNTAARSADLQSLKSLVFDGQIQQASALAQDKLERHERCAPQDAVAAPAELALLCGDLLLAQDHAEEAEELYRLAVRSAAALPRGQVRVVASRNTGFLSLYQQRFGTAVSCFQRVVEDEAAGAAQQVEALGGLALAHHGIGQSEEAMRALDEAGRIAEASDEAAGELAMLVRLLRIEIEVQREIRGHAALADHVFWQMPAVSATHARCEVARALQAGLEAYGHHPVVARRLSHLKALLQALAGDELAMQALHRHLGWLHGIGAAAAERQGRLETALVAIAAGKAELARSALALQTRQPMQRWSFELSYCQAKLCELTGRQDEWRTHYQRYALESLLCLRTETPAPRAAGRSGALGAVAAPKDEVEMSLPAKYRGAYRYMLLHLERADLSIREVAEHIGVTGRALQMAFRSHVGMTPAEVMRRRRVERIHEDLRQCEAGTTVIKTAARWGISNRSTLLSSYRKHIGESPAQTLARPCAVPPDGQLRAA